MRKLSLNKNELFSLKLRLLDHYIGIILFQTQGSSCNAKEREMEKKEAKVNLSQTCREMDEILICYCCISWGFIHSKNPVRV